MFVTKLKYETVIFVKVYLAINVILQREDSLYHVFILSVKNIENKIYFTLC